MFKAKNHCNEQNFEAILIVMFECLMGIFLTTFTTVFNFLPASFPFFSPEKGAFTMNAYFRR
jgi:hypothetical protein